MSSTNLKDAHLSSANLNNTYLMDIETLTRSQIKSACNWDKAFYIYSYYDNQKYEWIIDEEANKAYIEELKQDKSRDPETPPDCSKWE